MEDKPEHRVQHLKMVQAVIARLSSHRAQVKTWTVPLVVAVFAFARLSDEPDVMIGVAGFVPVILLGALDTRYLLVERCYRELYKAIASGEPVKPFNMDYRSYAGQVDSFGWVALSRTVVAFYLALIAILVILSAILAG